MQKNETLKNWAYKLDKVAGELPLEPLSKATHEFVNEINTLAEIENNKPDAFLVFR